MCGHCLICTSYWFQSNPALFLWCWIFSTLWTARYVSSARFLNPVTYVQIGQVFHPVHIKFSHRLNWVQLGKQHSKTSPHSHFVHMHPQSNRSKRKHWTLTLTILVELRVIQLSSAQAQVRTDNPKPTSTLESHSRTTNFGLAWLLA